MRVLGEEGEVCSVDEGREGVEVPSADVNAPLLGDREVRAVMCVVGKGRGSLGVDEG